MKMTIAESDPNMGLLTHTNIISFSPYVLAKANKMQIMTMSLASEQGEVFFLKLQGGRGF